jgi:hypothetical protein
MKNNGFWGIAVGAAAGRPGWLDLKYLGSVKDNE